MFLIWFDLVGLIGKWMYEFLKRQIKIQDYHYEKYSTCRAKQHHCPYNKSLYHSTCLSFVLTSAQSYSILYSYCMFLVSASFTLNIYYPLVKCLYVVTNISICAKPIRVQHVIYPVLYVVISAFFNGLHNYQCPVSIILGTVLASTVITVHMLLYSIYRLRSFLAQTCEKVQE